MFAFVDALLYAVFLGLERKRPAFEKQARCLLPAAAVLQLLLQLLAALALSLCYC